ncbi:hypothetical protein FIBSPDRAFT_928793 [Athelia psychrophila]|uniref:Uncharacterized protein n=1 Tax=Athelia psychrophila TaxID=1759441 RepID=A0A166PRG7_9AGAM|nr:hypothetical protein FIBSPDRAFT_928793 [Fibularhizoctonia sp. CBS 109695]
MVKQQEKNGMVSSSLLIAIRKPFSRSAVVQLQMLVCPDSAGLALSHRMRAITRRLRDQRELEIASFPSGVGTLGVDATQKLEDDGGLCDGRWAETISGEIDIKTTRRPGRSSVCQIARVGSVNVVMWSFRAPVVHWAEGVAIMAAMLLVLVSVNEFQKERQALNDKVLHDGLERGEDVVGDVDLLEPGEIAPVDDVLLIGHSVSPRATYLVPTTVLSPTVRGWEDSTGGEGGRAIGKGRAD